jgi:catechol 2,3-dioxygenase-like lactoylglutathione lyase family enzyme
MAPTIEKISAITFRVLNMEASVRFYRNVLGMELLTVEKGRGSLHCEQTIRNLRT